MDPVLKKVVYQIQAFPHCIGTLLSPKHTGIYHLRICHYLTYPLPKPCGMRANDKNIFNSLEADTKLQNIFIDEDFLLHTLHTQSISF
jgi:hypothetical protein